MTIAGRPSKRLLAAARTAGLRTTRGGLYGPRGKKANWQADLDQAGWLTLQRPAALAGPGELVAAHADWSGPVKLVGIEGGPVQRIELFVGNTRSPRFDRELQPAAEEQFHELLAGLFRRAGWWLDQDAGAWADWPPPATRPLAAWLAEVGHAVAMDPEGNLRMTVRASDRDGQVRVLCGPGRLRLVMPLGTWPSLGSVSRAAMLRLAGEANGHLRLARVAWRTTPAGDACEAQVDLTGVGCPSEAAEAGLFRDMTQMAVRAVTLALKRLGHELEILADPGHEGLAELVLL